MAVIIVPITLSIIGAIWFCRTGNESEEERSDFIPLIIFAGILVGAIGFLTVSGMFHPPVSEQNREVISTTRIVALKDNRDIQGHFYIAGGNISEKTYYYYMADTGNGYVMKKIEADKVVIKYADSDFRVEYWRTTSLKHWWSYLYTLPIGITCGEGYTIYVPKGSITHDFIIDME